MELKSIRRTMPFVRRLPRYNNVFAAHFHAVRKQ